METAAQGSSNGENDQEHHTIPEIVGQAIADGTSTLKPGAVPLSGTDGQSGSRKSGHTFCPGDAWTIGRQASSDGTTDYYVLMHYSADQRGDLSSYATGRIQLELDGK